MKTYILKVPFSQKADDWFRFINEGAKHTKGMDHLVVDFNEIKFLDTNDFVVLACLIESFYIEKCSVEFIGGTANFNNHLYNIKFKDNWREGYERHRFTLSHNKTTLCLWKITQDLIYSYSIFARQYFEKFANNKDLIPLASNMDEVFNNIFDHANSQISGYIITQYYPKSNRLSFSVCDFGDGIPRSIKKSGIDFGPEFEDWKAIIKSLEKGFSIKSNPRNRGFGLNNILELTENTNGSLLIISNNGIVKKKAGDIYMAGNSKFNFKGTLIKVEVDLNTFEDLDEVDQFFDF